MDTRTGELYDEKTLTRFLEGVVDNPPERNYFIPVVRDVTEREKADRQILLYSPCACGSGKKFKFCCHARK